MPVEGQNLPATLNKQENDLIESISYALIDRLDGQGIGDAITNLTSGKAVYTMEFNTKKGIKEVSGISWEGAKALLEVITAWEIKNGRRVLPNYDLEKPETVFIDNKWITTQKVIVSGKIVYYVRGQQSNFDMYGRKDELAPTKSLSKCERNAVLSIIPPKLKKNLVDYLSRKLGRKVVAGDIETGEISEAPTPEKPKPGSGEVKPKVTKESIAKIRKEQGATKTSNALLAKHLEETYKIKKLDDLLDENTNPLINWMRDRTKGAKTTDEKVTVEQVKENFDW